MLARSLRVRGSLQRACAHAAAAATSRSQHLRWEHTNGMTNITAAKAFGEQSYTLSAIDLLEPYDIRVGLFFRKNLDVKKLQQTLVLKCK